MQYWIDMTTLAFTLINIYLKWNFAEGLETQVTKTSNGKRFTSTSRLHLKPTSDDDYKEYSCQAKHKALQPDMPMKATVQLSVLCKSIIIKFNLSFSLCICFFFISFLSFQFCTCVCMYLRWCCYCPKIFSTFFSLLLLFILNVYTYLNPWLYYVK